MPSLTSNKYLLFIKYTMSLTILLTLSLIMWMEKNKTLYFMEIMFLNFKNMNSSIDMIMDKSSVLFFSTVMIISKSIYLYSMSYMKEESNHNFFFMIKTLFILSMILLIFSSNFLFIILGWDGLGITSFVLVMYYSNNLSLNSGIITIMTNRIGDIAILMSLILFIKMDTFNFIKMTMINIPISIILISMLLTAAFTKSAQIPFCAWLPAAMAAPTPISSLVHSSTLVTAGVYLLYRTLNTKFYMMLFLISSLTLILSNMASLSEQDFKKTVALSTLSHLSMMMLMMSMGFLKMAFIHLIMHAFFKALLFMTMGLNIHINNNYQDSRIFTNWFFSKKLNFSFMMISLISLCGLPFLSGFYSKDIYLEAMCINNLSLFIVMFSIMLSMMSSFYSIRFMKPMMFNFNNLTMNFKEKKTEFYFYSMILLAIMTMFMGSLIHNLNLSPITSYINLMNKYMIIMTLSTIMIMSFSIYLPLKKKSIMNSFFNKMFFLSSQSTPIFKHNSYQLMYYSSMLDKNFMSPFYKNLNLFLISKYSFIHKKINFTLLVWILPMMMLFMMFLI